MPVKPTVIAAALVASVASAWGQGLHEPAQVSEGLKEDGWVVTVARLCNGIAADLAGRAMYRVADEIHRYPDAETQLTVATLMREGQLRAQAELAANKAATCANLRAEHVTRLSEMSQGRLMDADQWWMATMARSDR